MGTIKRVKDFLLEVFGFKKNTKYVNNYLNNANVKSSISMGFIIICLEAWMIIRALISNVPDAMTKKNLNFFDALFTSTSFYWLFLFAGAAMMIFGIFYLKDKTTHSKTGYIMSIVFPAILVLYFFLIFKENLTNWSSQYYIVRNMGTIFLYIFSLFFALASICHTIYKLKYKKNSKPLSIVVMVFFSAICLTFGITFGYTDFFSRFYLGTGLPKATAEGTYEIKSFICFLTLTIYVGCLLIWKPFISVIILTSVFTFFGILVNSDPANRIFSEGELVNYITFLVSLTMICISIYVQRIHEALKDESLERIAKEDDLTHIFNNRHFNDEAEKKLLNAEKVEDYMFLFINIENFSTYNDEKGFRAGNEFLINFANLLEKEFYHDLVARQADDHFLVLTNNKEYMEIIKNIETYLKNETEVFLELKVGGFRPNIAQQNVRRAIDKARYAAGTIKQKYGVIYAEYDIAMHEKYHKQQYIINNIDTAIANGYIKAYYQPVVWSKNGDLCGCEALARWIDPKYGFLSPGDFVPILEEHRQIHKLDKCIFENVCKTIRDALDNNRKVVPVSLNFSRLDFELMDAVGEFEVLVDKYNIPKDYLHVEITESALTDNQDILKEAMDKLHKDNFAIWLDDFGSGYSSLNVLKDYDFDVLKIDMKFLTNFEKTPKSKDILNCIIQLAETIGMKTLTEGVETAEQAKFLEEIGCGRLQGYLFGKPLPLEDLRKAIAEGKYKVSDKIL